MDPLIFFASAPGRAAGLGYGLLSFGAERGVEPGSADLRSGYNSRGEQRSVTTELYLITSMQPCARAKLIFNTIPSLRLPLSTRHHFQCLIPLLQDFCPKYSPQTSGKYLAHYHKPALPSSEAQYSTSRTEYSNVRLATWSPETNALTS